jgi:hypothetical protein
MSMTRSVLSMTALIAGFIIVAVLAAITISPPDEALGPHILLVSADEPDLAPVETAVQGFRDAGFSVTTDAARVLERLTEEDSDVTVLAVTRETLHEVPDRLYRDLYGSGVVVIGLDVAMRELSPPTLGYESGPGALPYTPGMPVFAMVRANCGASSTTSDWLRNWPKIALLAIERSRDHCEMQR